MKTYKVPEKIAAILLGWDYLGFDSRNECTAAILKHEDWQQRYSVAGEEDTEQIAVVEDWRNSTLLELSFN